LLKREEKGFTLGAQAAFMETWKAMVRVRVGEHVRGKAVGSGQWAAG
jgi:hypothetical protein